MRLFSLGFSSCPNDTFIFDALVHHKINPRNISLNVHMADVEELNIKAAKNALDCTKMSIHAFLKLKGAYQMMDSGAAFGIGAGPLIISKKKMNAADLSTARIAIPGKNTTAALLLNMYMKSASLSTVDMLFSDIESAVLKNEVDAGLIIHENRFTYAQKGLRLLVDLGAYWDLLSNKLPLPLGGIALNHKLPSDIKRHLSRLVFESVDFAFKNPLESRNYIKEHAQEMEIDVMEKHIRTYVNKYSISMGNEGKKAILLLAELAQEYGFMEKFDQEKLFFQ